MNVEVIGETISEKEKQAYIDNGKRAEERDRVHHGYDDDYYHACGLFEDYGEPSELLEE